jgi:hypothetical protein
MPYVRCRACGVRVYTAAGHSTIDDCPRCGEPVIAATLPRVGPHEGRGSSAGPRPDPDGDGAHALVERVRAELAAARAGVGEAWERYRRAGGTG